MGTADPAHAGHRENGRCHRTRCQIDDSLAIRPRARDSLRRALADEQAVAGTAYVFLSGRSIFDRLGGKLSFDYSTSVIEESLEASEL